MSDEDQSPARKLYDLRMLQGLGELHLLRKKMVPETVYLDVRAEELAVAVDYSQKEYPTTLDVHGARNRNVGLRKRYADILIGKISEIVFYRFCSEHNILLGKPDLTVRNKNEKSFDPDFTLLFDGSKRLHLKAAYPTLPSWTGQYGEGSGSKDKELFKFSSNEALVLTLVSGVSYDGDIEPKVRVAIVAFVRCDALGMDYRSGHLPFEPPVQIVQGEKACIYNERLHGLAKTIRWNWDPERGQLLLYPTPPFVAPSFPPVVQQERVDNHPF